MENVNSSNENRRGQNGGSHRKRSGLFSKPAWKRILTQAHMGTHGYMNTHGHTRAHRHGHTYSHTGILDTHKDSLFTPPLRDSPPTWKHHFEHFTPSAITGK